MHSSRGYGTGALTFENKFPGSKKGRGEQCGDCGGREEGVQGWGGSIGGLNGNGKNTIKKRKQIRSRTSFKNKIVEKAQKSILWHVGALLLQGEVALELSLALSLQGWRSLIATGTTGHKYLFPGRSQKKFTNHCSRRMDGI